MELQDQHQVVGLLEVVAEVVIILLVEVLEERGVVEQEILDLQIQVSLEQSILEEVVEEDPKREELQVLVVPVS